MEIVELLTQLSQRLNQSLPGRHLYTVIGAYDRLEKFQTAYEKNCSKLRLPSLYSVNLKLLSHLTEEQRAELLAGEARGEYLTSLLQKHFEAWVTQRLADEGQIALARLELLFAYHVEIGFLRKWAIDTKKIVVLLPGQKVGGSIFLFHEFRFSERLLPEGIFVSNCIYFLD